MVVLFDALIDALLYKLLDRIIMAYIRLSGESTKDWLERLIVLDAPQDIRGDVRAILESESRLANQQQAGISNSTSLHHHNSIFS